MKTLLSIFVVGIFFITTSNTISLVSRCHNINNNINNNDIDLYKYHRSIYNRKKVLLPKNKIPLSFITISTAGFTAAATTTTKTMTLGNNNNNHIHIHNHNHNHNYPRLHHQPQMVTKSRRKSSSIYNNNNNNNNNNNIDHDILLRVIKGEKCHRTPVWLMRQAGRYMKDFRKFSDILSFKERSENPEIAMELSLQPWKKFHMDGVIMFSDIMTPFHGIGLDFDIVKGVGPCIEKPIRNLNDITQRLHSFDNPDHDLPFMKTLIQGLSHECKDQTTLLGFVGSPWTLAAHAIEGGSLNSGNNKGTAVVTKSYMSDSSYNDESGKKFLHTLLLKLTQDMAEYMKYQIENGIQCIQIFESWAHQLSPRNFMEFVKPYINLMIEIVKVKYPDIPFIYFSNGGMGFLDLQQRYLNVDVISIDWHMNMNLARKICGPKKILQGNIDPMVLVSGSKKAIKESVYECIEMAGGERHILNLGHGVDKNTPEDAVQAFVEAAKSIHLPL